MSGSSNKVGSTQEYVAKFEQTFYRSTPALSQDEFKAAGLATSPNLTEQSPATTRSELPQVDETAQETEVVCFKHVGPSNYAQWLGPALAALDATNGYLGVVYDGESSGCVTVRESDVEAALEAITDWGVLDV